MPAPKYIGQTAGVLTEVVAVQVGGGGNADKIPALDASGRLDMTMMPTGIGPDTAVIVASEALAAGDFVNVHNVTGSARVRKADASSAGKPAHGFVLASVSNGGNATVYFEGTNTQVTGQTPGPVYLSTTPGLATSTAPSTAGQVVQQIGFAIGSSSINLQSGPAVTLA